MAFFCISSLMPTTPRKRGRPRTPLPQRFRVMAWSHFVLAGSGLSQACDLEDYLAKKHRSLRLSRGLWSRYMRGETLPQGSLTARKRTLVHRVDDVVRGSAGVFFHPLWDLLDFGRSIPPEHLRSAYLQLDERIWHVIVRHSSDAEMDEDELDADFWYRQKSARIQVRTLDQRIGLDGLAGCMIEARMAYFCQNAVTYVAAHLAGCRILKQLPEQPEFSAKRMRSVLLLIETGWQANLESAFENLHEISDEERQARSAARDSREDWETRIKKHRRTLSKTALAVFRRWLGEAVELGIARSDEHMGAVRVRG